MTRKVALDPKVVYLKSIAKETVLSEYQIRAICREKSIEVTEGAAGEYISKPDRLLLIEIIGTAKRPRRHKPSLAAKDPQQEILMVFNRVSRLRRGLSQRDRADALAAISQCRNPLISLEKQRNLTRQDLNSIKELRSQLSSLHKMALTLPTKNLFPRSCSPNVSAGLPSLGKKKR